MMNSMYKSEKVTFILEIYLNDYDLIYLLDMPVEEEALFLNALINTTSKMTLRKRVLILSPSAEDRVFGNLSIRRITAAERDAFWELYATYEFSDRFQVFSGNNRSTYGNLWNYIRTGLLDVEDAVNAALWTAL